jgi:tetratricopeptide (TPR) repeat protein
MANEAAVAIDLSSIEKELGYKQNFTKFPVLPDTLHSDSLPVSQKILTLRPIGLLQKETPYSVIEPDSNYVRVADLEGELFEFYKNLSALVLTHNNKEAIGLLKDAPSGLFDVACYYFQATAAYYYFALETAQEEYLMKSLDILEKLSERNFNIPDEHSNFLPIMRGSVNFYLCKYEQSAKDFEYILRQSIGDDSRAFNNMGAILTTLGKYDEAEEYFYQAIMLHDRPKCWSNWAAMYLKSNTNLRRAKTYLSCNALSTDPQYPNAHYNLACVQSRLNDFDSAISSLELALSRKPSLFEWPGLLKDPDFASLKESRKDEFNSIAESARESLKRIRDNEGQVNVNDAITKLIDDETMIPGTKTKYNGVIKERFGYKGKEYFILDVLLDAESPLERIHSFEECKYFPSGVFVRDQVEITRGLSFLKEQLVKVIIRKS